MARQISLEALGNTGVDRVTGSTRSLSTDVPFGAVPCRSGRPAPFHVDFWILRPSFYLYLFGETKEKGRRTLTVQTQYSLLLYSTRASPPTFSLYFPYFVSSYILRLKPYFISPGIYILRVKDHYLVEINDARLTYHRYLLFHSKRSFLSSLQRHWY